jgi:hypothetical protein
MRKANQTKCALGTFDRPGVRMFAEKLSDDEHCAADRRMTDVSVTQVTVQGNWRVGDAR